jgi:hypothetical protein
MDLFFDILKILTVAAIVLVVVVWIVFENIALRDQNQKKDGDTE